MKYWIIFLMTYSYVLAQQDTIYFNHSWEVSNKQNAEFYRLKSQKIETKKAIGIRIKNIDSLYVIKDYYMSNHNLQFFGFSYTDNPLFNNSGNSGYVGQQTWYNEEGQIISSNYITVQKDKTSLFKDLKPIFYIEYNYVDRHNIKGGLEYVIAIHDVSKLFFGVGYGMVNYNQKIYGLLDYHISYNMTYLAFVKIGGSDKHIYSLMGISAFNFLDLGIGYSFPFKEDIVPKLKGFTIGLTLRLTKNENAVFPLNIIQ